MVTQSIQGWAHSVCDHWHSESLAYGAFLGVPLGIVTGVAYRVWNGIPAGFKQVPPFVPSPFHYQVLSDINEVMQRCIKGPYKYVLTLFPLGAIGYEVVCKAWQNRQISIWDSLKQEASLVPKAQLVRAITTIAVAVIICVTQPYWLPLVTTMIPAVSAKPSGHIVMQTSLSLAHAWTIQAADKAGYKKVVKICTGVSAIWGIANAIFIFNTLTVPFHNLHEVRDGILLSGIIIWISTRISKD